MGIARRRFLAGTILCSFILILAACARPLPPPPTSPTSTLQATTTPEASASPSPTAIVLPSMTPSPAPMALPAPLYFIDEGQIQRLEPDGVSRSQITAEPAPRITASAVLEFDIAAGGELAYTVATREGGSALIGSDAQGRQRRVLYERSGVEVSSPRWSPDGAAIAVRLTPDPALAPDVVPGVYLLPFELPAALVAPPDVPPAIYLPFVSRPDAQPLLLQADDVFDVNADPPSRQYIPQRWSPDGMALALDGVYYSNRNCSLAVKDLNSGALVTPRSPIEDAIMACDTAAWYRTGDVLMANQQRLGLPVLDTGLWVAVPWHGEVVPLIAPRDGEQHVLAIFPYETADRGIFVFLTRTTQQPDPSYSPPLQYTMYQLAADASLTPLRDDRFILREVRWAANDSGVAVVYMRNLTPALAWLPADGGPMLELDAEGFELSNLRWGLP